MEAFNRMSVAKLRVFAFAYNKVGKKSEVPSARGKLSDAKEGQRNLTKYCYDSQKNTNLLDERLQQLYAEGPPDDEVGAPADQATTRTPLLVSDVTLSKVDVILPSQILSSEEKVSLVRSLVDPMKLMEQQIVNEEMRARADVLLVKLRQRFDSRLPHRVRKKSLRGHWSLQLANDNLPVIAAAMVISDHVVSDLEPLGRLSEVVEKGLVVGVGRLNVA